MSLSSETSSIGGSLKDKDPRSPAAIAAFNKRRLNGDYGIQPNAPSIGIKVNSDSANTSAVKAASSRLGPKLWYPEQSKHALRASTLASSSSSSFIPEAHYVEDPRRTSLASQAANSALQFTGEEYGQRAEPDAYNWHTRPSEWAHLGAASSLRQSQRDQERKASLAAYAQAHPAQKPIDISKVMAAAQQNAVNRINAADNHLPANFGIQTEEQKAERRQQVLSLISIADQRVKARLADIDRDVYTPQTVFGSADFQRIALEVAAKTHSGMIENSGKLDLGGGLYMTPDEIDDIARRHVQPVLDKVQVVADKKRIADREAEEREALNKQLANEEKEAQRKQRAEEKQRRAEEKAQRKQAEALAKQKRERATARTKEQHPQGSHLWHWQQVEILKEEVKEAKLDREQKATKASQLHQAEAKTKEDLAALVDRHHELKGDYFQRGDAIEKKQAEYDPDAAETVSLFDLKQQRETVKQNTKIAKAKRAELEQKVEDLKKQAAEADQESEESQQRYHDLKKKYFEAREEAEEAEKKFQIEEEERLKREAEERARREAEEAENRRRAEEERAQREAEAATATAAGGTAGGAAGSSGAAEASSPSAASPAKSAAAPAKSAKSTKTSAKEKRKSSSGKAAGATSGAAAGATAGAAGATAAAASSVPDKYVPPPKSQLISLGDARSGPILSGYKTSAQPEKAPVKEAKSEVAEAPEAAKETEKEAPAVPEEEKETADKIAEENAEESAKAEENAKANAEENAVEKPEDGAVTEPAEETGAEATAETGVVPETVETELVPKGAEPAVASEGIDGEAKEPEATEATEATEAAGGAVPGSLSYESEAPKDTEAAAQEELPKVDASEVEPPKEAEAELEEKTATETPKAPEAAEAEKSVADGAKADGTEDRKLTYAEVVAKEEARAKETERQVSEPLTNVEDTNLKGVDEALKPGATEAQPLGDDVAGAVASNTENAELSEDIPLGEKKDQFSGFDSSNVKEKVEKSPGVFTEDL